MSATSAPFGFRPAKHPSGLDRANPYTIAASYATAIYKGRPVLLNTDGTLNVSAGNDDIIGIFNGVQYNDATGKPVVSDYWPGATTGATNIVAWVVDDPATIFEVQADGSIAATAVGDQADGSNLTAGSTVTGLSQATLSSTLKGAGVQGQFRIVGFGQGVDNAAGDAYTVVQVQIARHQYVANKVAI